MDKSIIQEKIVSVLREKDFLAKAVCLLLAVILWAFIVSGRTENLRFKIPITAKNVPFQLAVSKMSERYATILIEGRKEHLKEVSVKNIKAVVNLKNALAGEPQDYPIQLEKQQVPEDVSISLVNSEVTVTLERMEEKWVMVVPNIVGTVQKGKIVIDKIVIPDRVKISGPKSVINDVESIETDDVSVQNEAGDLQLQVALKKDKSGDVTCDEISVTVKVVIADLKDLVTITVPAEIQNINRDYEYEIKDQEIELYIRSRNYRQLSPDDVDVHVDAGKLNVKSLFENESGTEVIRELPVIAHGKNINTADIVSIMPKKVKVAISKKKIQTAPEKKDVPD